jgi:hypothetical protein
MAWLGRQLRGVWSAYETALHRYPMRTQIATSASLWCAPAEPFVLHRGARAC